jgi:hypothetical protein
MDQNITKTGPFARFVSAMKSLLSPPRVKRVRIG